MAFSGSQQTGLKPNALPGQPYGSFSGKTEAIVSPIVTPSQIYQVLAEDNIFEVLAEDRVYEVSV